MKRSVCSMIGSSMVGSLISLLLAGHAFAGGGGVPNQVGESAFGAKRSKSSPPRQQGVAAPTAVRPETSGELVFGTPVNYQNLTLVPVGTTKQGPFQKYTLLEQGLDEKTLEVREMRGEDDGAEVNAVQVRNSGKNPAYLLSGEAILGGKQDRIIEHDTVLPANKRWTRVAVFCVEAGRWAGQNMKFQAGKALAHVALRQAALSGNQSKVWAEVAAKNTQQGTSNRTQTYRRTIQNEKVRGKIAPYRAELVKSMPKDLSLAGVLMAINGRIRVADVFGNPILFRDIRDKLLSAYVLEALGQQVIPNAPRVSAGAAKGFIEEGRKAKGMSYGKSGAGLIYKKRTPNLVGSETVDEGSGEKVRESYISQ